MNRADLADRLRRGVEELDDLIGQVNVEAQQYGIRPMELRDTTGALTLAPLITAQANALAALVQLEVTS